MKALDIIILVSYNKIMKKYQTILFDLDGTLTDPKIGITKSIQHALNGFDIHAELKELEIFIGPPLRVSFSKNFGISMNDIENIALPRYRDYYSNKGMFECEIYGGVCEMLEKLKSEGMTTSLATSKPLFFAKPILQHFGLLKYFDFVSGSELDGTRDDKADVISYALENLKLTPAPNIIMVGDREFDIIGAKKNNLQSIGVLYGYGDRKELETAGASIIAKTVSELTNILTQKD